MNTPLTWRQADHDVYVATHDGEYAGFVTVDGATHVLHDRHSRRLGSYPSLSAARTALSGFAETARAETAAASPSARRPGSSQPRRRRRRAHAAAS